MYSCVVSTLAFEQIRDGKGHISRLHISSVNENVYGLVSKIIPEVTKK